MKNIDVNGHKFILTGRYDKREFKCQNCGCFILCEDHGYYYFALWNDECYNQTYGSYDNIEKILSCNEVIIKNIIE